MQRFSIIILLLCALVSSCSPSNDNKSSKPAQAAPDLVLSKVDGSGQFALSKQKGKVVLVDLWATWCLPCIEELPYLQEISDRFNPEDFLMLGIVLESGNREEVLDFILEKQIRYTTLLGEEDTSEAFGPFVGYPTKYLIDKNGIVLKRYFGIVGKVLMNDVETLLDTGSLTKVTG